MDSTKGVEGTREVDSIKALDTAKDQVATEVMKLKIRWSLSSSPRLTCKL